MWGISIIRHFQNRVKDTEFLGNASSLDRIFLIFAKKFQANEENPLNPINVLSRQPGFRR